jgi:hypothetical protein
MAHPRLLIPLSLALLTACGDGDGQKQRGNTLVIGEGEQTPTTSLHSMPTPNELFSLVRDMVSDGQVRLLNPHTHSTRYVSQRARAINFGVYCTDLVFASFMNMKADVARYYLVTKSMAESLGLKNAFTDADFARLEANLARGDSLEVISNEGYLRAYQRMQEEDMGPVLSLVLAGGWIESMHLVLRQIEAYGANEALMRRVAEQKVSLEHLLALMEQYSADPEVAPVYMELMAIRDLYDTANVVRSAPTAPSASGRMVLGDEVRILITPELHAELARAVDATRAAWTRPESENTI